MLGKPEPWVHRRLVRYGRGNFEIAALKTTFTSSKFKVNASIEYANLLGELITSQAKGEGDVKGNIIAWSELEDEIQKRGLTIIKSKKKGERRVIEVQGRCRADKITELYTNYPESIFLLNLKFESPYMLRCKKNPPRPGNPLDEDFCSATFGISALQKFMDEVAFDVEIKHTPKNMKISHILMIEELVAPPEIQNNPSRFRVEAKRKGKIKRVVEIDGNRVEREYAIQA